MQLGTARGRSAPKASTRNQQSLTAATQGRLRNLKGRSVWWSQRNDRDLNTSQNACGTAPSLGKSNEVAHTASGDPFLTGGIGDVQRGARFEQSKQSDWKTDCLLPALVVLLKNHNLSAQDKGL